MVWQCLIKRKALLKPSLGGGWPGGTAGVEILLLGKLDASLRSEGIHWESVLNPISEYQGGKLEWERLLWESLSRILCYFHTNINDPEIEQFFFNSKEKKWNFVCVFFASWSFGIFHLKFLDLSFFEILQNRSRSEKWVESARWGGWYTWTINTSGARTHPIQIWLVTRSPTQKIWIIVHKACLRGVGDLHHKEGEDMRSLHLLGWWINHSLILDQWAKKVSHLWHKKQKFVQKWATNQTRFLLGDFRRFLVILGLFHRAVHMGRKKPPLRASHV